MAAWIRNAPFGSGESEVGPLTPRELLVTAAGVQETHPPGWCRAQGVNPDESVVVYSWIGNNSREACLEYA